MQTLQIFGVSLGSSRRDFQATVELAGVQYQIARYGTDGDMGKALALLRSLEGKVDAIGLGGVNLAYVLGKHRYSIKEGLRLAGAAKSTPLVDGEFVKREWEPKLIGALVASGRLNLAGKKVLLSSALDRYHLGRCLEQLGARVWVGDALLALKIPLLFPSVKAFGFAAVLTMPLLSQLPLSFLYPLGKKQEKRKRGWDFLINNIQVFAGDFHLLNRYLPDNLSGKTFITSTLTSEDRAELVNRGAAGVYPLGLTLSGRSIGANILDGILSAAAERGVYGTNDRYQVMELVLDYCLKYGLV